MRPCSRRDCSEVAAREVIWTRSESAPQDPGEVIGAYLCERHASEIDEKRCAADDCTRLADMVVTMQGHGLDGSPKQEDVQFCDSCWETLQAAPSVAVDGVLMVHDGAGNFKAIPPNIGQG